MTEQPTLPLGHAPQVDVVVASAHPGDAAAVLGELVDRALLDEERPRCRRSACGSGRRCPRDKPYEQADEYQRHHVRTAPADEELLRHGSHPF